MKFLGNTTQEEFDILMRMWGWPPEGPSPEVYAALRRAFFAGAMSATARISAAINTSAEIRREVLQFNECVENKVPGY